MLSCGQAISSYVAPPMWPCGTWMRPRLHKGHCSHQCHSSQHVLSLRQSADAKPIMPLLCIGHRLSSGINGAWNDRCTLVLRKSAF